MSRVDSPALRGSWLGTLLRFLNPVVRLLLASPVHWPLSRWFLLVSWTGAKTGQTHTTPVSYVSDGGALFVTTGDRWTRFAVDNATFRVRYSGRWSPATATLVSDAEQSRVQHVRLFDKHNWYRVLAGIPKAKGHTDETAVTRAIAFGRKLVRIDLVPDQPT